MIKYEIKENDTENGLSAEFEMNGGQIKVLTEAVIFTKLYLAALKKVEKDKKTLIAFKHLYLKGVKEILKDNNFDINEFTMYAVEMFKLIDDKGEL